jgi:hypothetical protein
VIVPDVTATIIIFWRPFGYQLVADVEFRQAASQRQADGLGRRIVTPQRPGGFSGRSFDDANRGRYLDEPSNTFVTNFFGRQSVAAQGPQGFLVEIPPDYHAEPHFHGVNQFQLFVSGSGLLGRRPVGPGDYHYADAWTTYGPIISGPMGLVWFTLRQTGYVGRHYMPGSQALLDHYKPSRRRGRGRRLGRSASASEMGSSELLHDPDGLAVYRLTVIPGQEVPGPSLGGNHGGAYIVVLDGAVLIGATRFDRRSCLYLDPGQALAQLYGGNLGADLMFMSFPIVGDLPERSAELEITG